MTIHEPNREASRLPWLPNSFFAGLRKSLPFRKAHHIHGVHTPPDISPYETPLALAEVTEWLRPFDIDILSARTVWFFAVTPLKLPRLIAQVYYLMANVVDAAMEKFHRYQNRAGALLIIARKARR